MGGEWWFHFTNKLTKDELKEYQKILIRFRDKYKEITELIGLQKEEALALCKWTKTPKKIESSNIFVESTTSGCFDHTIPEITVLWNPNIKTRENTSHARRGTYKLQPIFVPLQQLIRNMFPTKVDFYIEGLGGYGNEELCKCGCYICPRTVREDNGESDDDDQYSGDWVMINVNCHECGEIGKRSKLYEKYSEIIGTPIIWKNSESWKVA